MRDAAKKAYKISVLLMQTIVSLLSVLLFSKKNCKRYFDSIHKDCEKEDSLYILGNGSSLDIFLNSGKSFPYNMMVVNHFASSPMFNQLRPRHYIIVDNNLCIAPEKHNSKQREILIQQFLDVKWEMNLFLPGDSSKDLIKKLQSNEYLNLVLFNRTRVSGFHAITDYLYDLKLGMPIPQNVSNAAVFCGIASGFRNIYLYGAEHSWTKSFDVDPDTHRVFMNDGHFYEKDNLRYLAKGEYKEWLLAIYLALKSHEELRRYADKKGVRIINKSEKSFVDAYDFE